MSEISRDEFLDWKRNAVTQVLLGNLEDRCKDLMNEWARARFTNKESFEQAALVNAAALGHVEVLSNLIDSINAGAFARISDGDA